MARFLVDVNLPRNFSGWAGDDYVFVRDIDATWSDRTIWDHARANGFIIISQDADFIDRALLEPESPKIIHMRLGNIRLREWRVLMSRLWPEILLEISAFRIVVVFKDTLDCIE